MSYRVFLVFVIPLILSGCLEHPSRNIVDPDYKLPSRQSQKGLVALSIQCQSNYLKTINISYNSNPAPMFYDQKYYEALIADCNNLGSRIDRYLIQLPAGNYNITSITPTGEISKMFKPIFFSVKPGVLTYAGRILIFVYPPKKSRSIFFTNPTKYRYGIRNFQDNDFAYFKRIYSNIPSTKYKINLMKLKK